MKQYCSRGYWWKHWRYFIFLHSMEKRTILHSKWTLLKSTSRYRNNYILAITFEDCGLASAHRDSPKVLTFKVNFEWLSLEPLHCSRGFLWRHCSYQFEPAKLAVSQMRLEAPLNENFLDQKWRHPIIIKWSGFPP